MESGNKPILDLARKLMATEGPAEFFRNLATAVREEMEADWVAVWIHERKKKSFILEVGVPPNRSTTSGASERVTSSSRKNASKPSTISGL